MIENLPKGAIPDPHDPRDFGAAPFLASLPPVDWTKGSGLPRPPLHDQNQSDSCVAHAWSYYHWQVTGKDFSRRDLFSRIAQSYGSYIRDGGLEIIKNGQQTEAQLPDPSPETPANMRDKTGVTPAAEKSGQEANSFVLAADIESVARAIVAYKGVVFGVLGTNAQWADLANPLPPPPGTPDSAKWGHCLYAVDFHIDSDGQKCIIAVTSWPSAGITEHHIREDYFLTGNTFNPWTLIPQEQQMNQFVQTMNYNGTIGVFVPTSDKLGIPELNSIFNVSLTVNPDGTIPTQKTVTDK